jgi:hypothetical protein
MKKELKKLIAQLELLYENTQLEAATISANMPTLIIRDIPQPLITGERPQDFENWAFTAKIEKNQIILVNGSYLIEANYYGTEKMRIYFKLN